METTVWFNPACGNCQTTQGILAERGIDAEMFEYSRPEIERVMKLLGTDDPRDIIRTKEAVYSDLGLADATADQVLDAMAAHPVLIQRPIVIRGDRAIVARPAERVLELLDDGGQDE